MAQLANGERPLQLEIKHEWRILFIIKLRIVRHILQIPINLEEA